MMEKIYDHLFYYRKIITNERGVKMNLPIVAEEHEQERRSITEFKRLMEDGNFIVRDYRESDYGVDLVLEIKLDGKYASNFGACIQLKDKLDSSTIINKEGSYTYQIDISKINYLSNKPNSIFCIYLEDKKEFVWQWVYEIEKSAINKNINLDMTEQKKYSYKFCRVLDESNKKEIHEHIKMFGEKIKKYSKKMMEYKDSGYDKVLLNTNIDELNILDSFTNKLSKAEEYYKNNDLRNAVREYEHITSIVKDEKLFLTCGKIYLELRKYHKAIKKYNYAREKNSENYQVFLGLGFAYRGLKKYKESIEYMQEALKYNDNAEILFALGQNYIAIGDSYNALSNLKYILKKNGLNETFIIEVELLVAYIYSLQFNFAKWKEFIDRVLSKDKNNSIALGLLGEYYINLDEESKAIQAYHDCLENDQYNYSGLLGLSLIYCKSDIEKTVIFLNELIKKYYYKKFINIKEGKIAIIQVGWKKTNYLVINKTKEGFLELVCDEDQKVALDITKENGIIFIGKAGDIETGYTVPIVGKAFKKKKEYDNCISLIEKKLELIKDFTESKQSIDLRNETELIIEEGRECIYLKIKFKDYSIIGFTDPNYGKRGFNEFTKEYAKSKCFQVQISCEETEEVLFYVVNDNVTVINNY